VLLESPRRVRFNRVYFTIFRAKVWKILNFELILFAGNSNKLPKKLGLEGKNQFQNPQCVHTWTQATLVALKEKVQRSDSQVNPFDTIVDVFCSSILELFSPSVRPFGTVFLLYLFHLVLLSHSVRPLGRIVFSFCSSIHYYCFRLFCLSTWY